MEKLLVKFNEITENKFDFIRLSSVVVNVRKCFCEYTFIYPADKERLVADRREYIESTLLKILKKNVDVQIKLKKSHFDFDFFKADFFAFLSAFPMIAGTLSDKDITCRKEQDDTFLLQLVLQQSVYDYCMLQNIRGEIDDYLYTHFCEDIRLELLSHGSTQVEVSSDTARTSEYKLDRPDEGRLIRPQNVEEFIGRIIYEPAGYIEDASPKENAVLCGTLSKIYEQQRKPKEGEQPSDKKFFKFSLEDYTGKISCVYFPTKKTVDMFGLLLPGKQIVARGKIEEDTYRGEGALSFRIHDICLCTLPQDFTPNRLRRRVPDAYKTVLPQKYVEEKQYSLFEAAAKPAAVPPFMLGKTFVVFDIETTGFNPDLDKIIEIGAVKVQDGKVTETFSTFIDPCMPIPERITKLTHIEDADVKGQPRVEEVMPDFYKFTDGAILVGQNVQFDYGFIKAYGMPLCSYFDNMLMDTLSLAKTYYPGLKNYKLGTLTKHFGVENKGAHRAVYDAWATMEVFMKLAEKLA